MSNDFLYDKDHIQCIKICIQSLLHWELLNRWEDFDYQQFYIKISMISLIKQLSSIYEQRQHKSRCNFIQ